jgi:hypothetical protein
MRLSWLHFGGADIPVCLGTMYSSTRRGRVGRDIGRGVPRPRADRNFCPTNRLWLFLLLLFLNAIPASAEDVQPFPIMAWSGVPQDAAMVKRMKDCGLTIVGPDGPDALDRCQAAGLKMLLRAPETEGYGNWQGVDPALAEKNAKTLAARLSKHPALWGYYLTDEPHAALFPGIATVQKAFAAADPNHLAFTNLLPNYATADQQGAKTYEEYLERFVEIAHPPILSYDFYGLNDDGSLRDGYFQNLETARRVSVKHKVPFFNVVLALAHFTFRVPSDADFNFQAFTTLAMGGKGIVYFMYMTPSVGNYRLGPVDQFGNETPTWYAMQQANLKVQKLGPTMLKLKSDDAYHIGKVPHDCHGPSDKSFIKTIPGGEYLVGEFTHEDGSRYVMIVNKDVKKSRYLAIEWNKPPKDVQLISNYSGQPTPFVGEQCWLAPGDGILLKVSF